MGLLILIIWVAITVMLNFQTGMSMDTYVIFTGLVVVALSNCKTK